MTSIDPAKTSQPQPPDENAKFIFWPLYIKNIKSRNSSKKSIGLCIIMNTIMIANNRKSSQFPLKTYKNWIDDEKNLKINKRDATTTVPIKKNMILAPKWQPMIVCGIYDTLYHMRNDVKVCIDMIECVEYIIQALILSLALLLQTSLVKIQIFSYLLVGWNSMMCQEY